jgi:hypothetical protein
MGLSLFLCHGSPSRFTLILFKAWPFFLFEHAYIMGRSVSNGEIVWKMR